MPKSEVDASAPPKSDFGGEDVDEPEPKLKADFGAVDFSSPVEDVEAPKVKVDLGAEEAGAATGAESVRVDARFVEVEEVSVVDDVRLGAPKLKADFGASLVTGEFDVVDEAGGKEKPEDLVSGTSLGVNPPPGMGEPFAG